MAEKQAKKKEILEFKNYADFQENFFSKKELPPIFVYCSEDSFEFDLVTDLYRKDYVSKQLAYEVVVFVAELGDFEKLSTELFNFSMFSKEKLVIIRSGNQFFKQVLTASKKEEFENFKRSIHQFPETTKLLIHYDSKDLPSKFISLFDSKFALLKNRNLYAEERRPSLESILKLEKVHFSEEAKDEFIHRTTPNIGAYTKSVRKLKSMLSKKEYGMEDIEEVLFISFDFNPFYAVDYLFKNQRSDFFRELSKLKLGGDPAHLLGFLNILLDRTDEVRKASVLFKRFKGSVDEGVFNKILGFQSFSEGRKKFVRSRLLKESRIFTDSVLSEMYRLLLDLNKKAKLSMIPDIFYLSKEFEKIFFALSINSYS